MNQDTNKKNKSNSAKGFAGMDPEQQREIASKGGQAAHQSGNAHEWDSQEAKDAGRLGGQNSRGSTNSDLEEE